jgi:hypothetical protein
VGNRQFFFFAKIFSKGQIRDLKMKRFRDINAFQYNFSFKVFFYLTSNLSIFCTVFPSKICILLFETSLTREAY